MPAIIGAAEFLLGVNLGGFTAGMAAAQREAATGSARIQQTVDGNFKKAEQSANRLGGSFRSLGAAAATLTGFGAIASGLVLVHAGMVKVAEQTQKTAQTQFALNKVYGDAATQYRAFAQAQAQVTGRSANDFQQASVRAATLAKNYGLTSAQIQVLIQRSADLAAVHGKDVPDAAERVIAAIRGEGEAAEALGLTLNSDAVKAFGAMTDAQRKNFETLDQVSKAQIIYRELLRQTNDVQGAAVERANSQVGAFDRLTAATDKTAASIGERLVPSLATGAGALATYLERAQGVQQRNAAMAASFEDFARRYTTALGPLSAIGFFDLITGRATRPTIPDTRAADEGRHEGVDVAEAVQARRSQAIAEAAERKRAIKEELDARKDDVERRAQIEIDGLEKEKQAAERSYAARRAALQNQRDAELKAAEQVRDGAIKAIEEQAQAAEDGYRRQVIAAEKARDAELRAAEDRRDGAIEAIEAEQDAAEAANEAQIRQFEIERDRARQAAEDRRDAAIDALDAEKRARDTARVQEDRATDDATTAAQRAIEARHDAAITALQDEAKAAERTADRKVRALDREIEKAREASAKRLAALDRAADRESALHERTMRALDDERDARLGVLDAQLKALDAQEDAVDAAERMANLQQRLAAAQRGVAAAQGTGTPQQVGEAREALTRAIRVGNEVSIANARAQLQQLAGQGAQAIAKAQEELADTTGEIQREQTKQARDGERDRLTAAKDAISDELDARKRAEDDRNAAREREIASDRDAEQKKLATRLNALERQKKAAQDSSRDELERIKERVDAEKESHDLIVQQERDIALQAKRAVDDRRRAEDQADQDKRREINELHELEQRQIKATYDDEETGIIPALKRAADVAEREFKRRKDAVNDLYKTEQDQVRLTYDDPETGVIAKIKAQAEATKRDYDAAKTAVNERYQAEKDRIAEVYDDPEHGLFAKLEKSKQATIDALNDQIQNWQGWKAAVVKEIGEALAALDAFIARVGSLENISVGNVTPDEQGQVPGGVGPPIPRGFKPGRGGDLAYGPVVRNASPDSYWTSGGTHGGHPAADIFAPKGSPIYAPVGGRSVANAYPLGGNTATMIGDDGRAYYFAHGNVPFVSGRVERGDEIGQVGNSGNAQFTAPHLHFAIATNANKFGELNGSGDINGDSSYWGEGGTANARGAADDEIEIMILGRRIRVRARSMVPGAVGRSIAEALSIANLPRGWSVPLGQIAAAESGERRGDGTVVLGTGSSRAVNPTAVNGEHASGLMQTLPSTFRGYAVPGHGDIFNPVDNVAAAARYIEARYGSPWNTPYYRNGAFSTIGVSGYRTGTMITEPTLLAGLTTGRLGIAGETGQPERLLGVEDTRTYGRGGDVTTINVMGIGLNEVAAEIERRQHRQQLLRGGRR